MKKINDTVKLMMERRSIRNYTDEEVNKDILDTILQCGIHAPSSSNKQSWRFTAITNLEMIKTLDETLIEFLKDKVLSQNQEEALMAKNYLLTMQDMPNQSAYYNAPCVIIVSAEDNNYISAVDCGLAAENICLAAQSYDYNTCITSSSVMHLNNEKYKDLKNQLKIENNFNPIFAILLGKSNQEQPETPERDYSKIHYYI